MTTYLARSVASAAALQVSRLVDQLLKIKNAPIEMPLAPLLV